MVMKATSLSWYAAAAGLFLSNNAKEQTSVGLKNVL